MFRVQATLNMEMLPVVYRGFFIGGGGGGRKFSWGEGGVGPGFWGINQAATDWRIPGGTKVGVFGG
jgi:hypothetical protein